MPFELLVNGGLMRGLRYHHNMFGSEFLREARTAPRYRLYSISDDWHPGMFEVEEGGVSVAGEIFLVQDEIWPLIEATEPPNLYRGYAWLDDGTQTFAILYPRDVAEKFHRDISDYDGSWRTYLASRAQRT